MPFAYPVFLSLENEHCLVAGLGDVGKRKLAGLLAAGVGSVLALDTSLPENPAAASLGVQFAWLAEDPRVSLANHACNEEDVRASRLVFAATGDPKENERIASLCREAKVLCNCASDPELGQFALPAVTRYGEICCALSTGGSSPALARQLRCELQDLLKPHAALANFLGKLRPYVIAMNEDSGQNSQLFRKLTASPLGGWLAAGKFDACRDWLNAELHPILATQGIVLLNDLAQAPSTTATSISPVPGGESHEFF